DPIQLRADPLQAKLRDQKLELAVLDEDRLERREEQLPCLLGLAPLEQRLCRFLDLTQRGHLAPGGQCCSFHRVVRVGLAHRPALPLRSASRCLRARRSMTSSWALMAISSATASL